MPSDISTSFVDRLQSYPSPASTPPQSSPTSRASSLAIPRTHDPESLDASEHSALISNTTNEYGTLPSHHHHHAEHSLDSLPARDHLPHRSISISTIPHTPAEDDIFSGGHHRHEPRSSHYSHHSSSGPGRRQSLQKLSEDVQVTTTPVPSQQTHSKYRSGSSHRPHNLNHGHDHGHAHLTMEHWDPDSHEDEGDVELTAEVKIGHRRQVVGILVSLFGFRRV